MSDSVALFIDLENIVTSLWKTYQQRPDFFRWLEQARAYGPIAFGRAYGDFSQPSIVNVENDLRNLGIDKFDCPAKQNGQSTVDSNVIIDLYEVALDQPNVKTFILMAGDSDYIRVVAKLRQRMDKRIVIMGVPGSVSRDLVRAAGNDEPLEPMAELTVDKAAVIRLIDQYETSRRPGTLPTFRFMRDYLAHPKNVDVVRPQMVESILSDFIEQGILTREMALLEDGREVRTTKLDRSQPAVQEALRLD